MKKHQKFLVGLMILGLAGGVGTAFALTRNDSSGTTHSRGTDQAIYLYWDSDNSSNASVVTEVKDLQAQTPVYRNVIVSPKASATAEGTVKVSFALSIPETNVLTGLSIDIYETSSYLATESATDTASATLTTTNLNKDFEISVNGSSTASKYYLLKFVWDGSQIASDKTFGGTLKISQSFKE